MWEISPKEKKQVQEVVILYLIPCLKRVKIKSNKLSFFGSHAAAIYMLSLNSDKSAFMIFV